jgi:hypothetical protein
MYGCYGDLGALMNEYVFIDNNNGHRCDYYNFTSNASPEQIAIATEDMRKQNPAYGRMGSSIFNLAEKLVASGFVVTLEDNPRNRRYIDRIAVDCISGNY